MARVLDGCCNAGGASRGYVDAGHTVTGLDIEPQPNYLKSGASAFIQADILEYLATADLGAYDFIHVSPPCQHKSRMSHCRPGLAERYPDLVAPVRELLDASGLPYVIEQPEGDAQMINPATLCCWMFGYETYRHRWFEAGGGFKLADPPAQLPPPIAPRSCGWDHPVPAARAGHWEPGRFVSVAGHERVGLTRAVMAIGWTNREELAEAIPPYMAQWVGRQIPGRTHG